MSLPKDAQARKGIPIYEGFIRYFPDAIAAIAQCSFVSNEQHHPGTPVHWDKSKSYDELDALMRHMIDGTTEDRDEEGIMHEVKLAWRALANLQRLADSGLDIYAAFSSIETVVLETEPMIIRDPQAVEDYIERLNEHWGEPQPES